MLKSYSSELLFLLVVRYERVHIKRMLTTRVHMLETIGPTGVSAATDLVAA